MTFKDKLAIGSAFVGLYLGLTLAVNAAMLPFQAGLELLLNEDKKEFNRATLKKKGTSFLLNTKGQIGWGEFELPNKKTIKIYDSQRILQGKWFSNSKMPGLEEGTIYDLSTIGNNKIGYNVLEADEVGEK